MMETKTRTKRETDNNQSLEDMDLKGSSFQIRRARISLILAVKS